MRLFNPVTAMAILWEQKARCVENGGSFVPRSYCEPADAGVDSREMPDTGVDSGSGNTGCQADFELTDDGWIPQIDCVKNCINLDVVFTKSDQTWSPVKIN